MASPRDRKHCREASRSGHTFPGDVGDPPSISTARREWPANKVRLAARQRPMSHSGGVARCREPCGYERGGLFRELIDDAPVARTGYLSWFRQDGWFGEAAREGGRVAPWRHRAMGRLTIQTKGEAQRSAIYRRLSTQSSTMDRGLFGGQTTPQLADHR